MFETILYIGLGAGSLLIAFAEYTFTRSRKMRTEAR
jgi:hypothetical protein